LILTEIGGGNGAHLTNVNVLTSEPGLYGVGCGTHSERQLIVAETIDKFLKPMVVGRNVADILNTSGNQPGWHPTGGPV
jgi:mannonate dehydratase